MQVTRGGNSWNIIAARFDKAYTEVIREKAARHAIDPRIDYYGHPEVLTIDGEGRWQLTLPNGRTFSGTLQPA
jgi:hypothetical protein